MKTDTKTIGGLTYRMEQLGAGSGNQVLLRLAKPFAQALSAAAAAGIRNTSREDLVIRGIGPALAALSGDDLEYVCKAFAEKTTVSKPDGKKLRDWPLATIFDDHFAGKYADEMVWLRWAIEMNHLFGDALSQLDQLRAESASSSPKAASGLSGDSSSTATAPRD